MAGLRPKYISFDCYGTLTRFRIGDMAREQIADRLPADRIDGFVRDFSGYRVDEVMGAWKPYAEVIANAMERTCKRWKVEFRPAEARAIYEASFGPLEDNPDMLALYGLLGLPD